MRLLGVSNDLRDRGDEWPLLKVVKGLSVVVATVVDEVSIAASSALRFRSYLCGAQTWPLRLGCSSALARGCAPLRTCRIAAYLRESRSNAAVLARFGQISDFENPRPTSGTSGAKNLCARSPTSHQFGKTGGCTFCRRRRRLTQPSKQQHIALNQSTARPCADSQTSRLASLLSCQDT